MKTKHTYIERIPLMKKKILIILPIIVIALIVIVVISKHNNNDIEETPQEVVEISEVSEPTPEPEKTPEPQPEVNEPETVEPEATEPEPEVTEPETIEPEQPEQTEESDIEPLDKVMYATGNINTRSGPSVDFTKVGGLTVNQEVHVTGQSKTTSWYEIEVNGEKQYVSHTLLSDTKVQESKPSSNDNTSSSGNGGGGSTTSSGNGNTNAKAMEVLKSLGVDTSKDASQDVAAPAPEFGGHRSSGEGIHAE